MSYLEIMESFHRRVAGVYKLARENGADSAYIERSIDAIIVETMEQLRLLRRVPKGVSMCTVKALIF